jgi:hypothetical protein
VPGASSSTPQSLRAIERSTFTAREQPRSPLERASEICWADSNDGLLNYTHSFGVDSLFAMAQLMMNTASDLAPLVSGAPTVATRAIGEVRSALAQAAAAETRILDKMPPPPAVPDTLVATAVRAVANLDRVTVRNKLRACEFTVSEATVDGWTKVVTPSDK